MIWSSTYEDMIFMATCFRPAKNIPSPTSDSSSKYFDAKATRETPRWVVVDVEGKRKTRLLSLAEMRTKEELATMQVLQKGSRLSITPVTAAEWNAVLTLLESEGK